MLNALLKELNGVERLEANLSSIEVNGKAPIHFNRLD